MAALAFLAAPCTCLAKTPRRNVACRIAVRSTDHAQRTIQETDLERLDRKSDLHTLRPKLDRRGAWEELGAAHLALSNRQKVSLAPLGQFG